MGLSQRIMRVATHYLPIVYSETWDKASVLWVATRYLPIVYSETWDKASVLWVATRPCIFFCQVLLHQFLICKANLL